MKLIHLSDLHLGKRVHGFSMLADQTYILKQILQIIQAEKPDGVILAGDLYDKAVPSAEAVELLDDFLVALSKENFQTFLISGNHDSPERLAFGGRLMSASGIHMSPVYHGQIEPVSLTDDYGMVDIYLLPFLKPAHVRRYFPEAEIASYTDAVAAAVGQLPLVPEHRNVLVTHQFVTGALPSDSEEISVGGTDHVEAQVFQDFDYVALGHIHGPQNIGSPRLRYCGTPLKYSFSEARHEKSVTVAELGEKGQLTIRTIPLKPLHDMVEIRGRYEEITDKAFYADTTWQTDYTHITLIDEEDIPDAVGKLRSIYHNLMKLDYDNKRTQYQMEIQANEEVERKTPLQLFLEFYEMQNNQPMSPEQAGLAEKWIKEIWEGEA